MFEHVKREASNLTSTKGQTMKKLLLALVMGCSMSVSASYAKDTITSDQIFDMVTIQAEKHNVPTNLAHAVIKLESNYDPNARGQKNEYGLGQILCSTARGEGFKGKCDQLKDPYTNLEYVMAYLRSALDLTNNDICQAATYYASGYVVQSKKKTAYCKKMLDNIK